MRKILFMLMITVILACPVLGASLRQQQVSFVDEFGDPVTTITSITVFNSGLGTSPTIFSDRAGTITVTNPITTSSTNSTFDQSLGLVRWFQQKPTYKLTVTDGTKTLTIDTQNESDTRFPWYDNYIGTAASLSVNDNQSITVGTDSDYVLAWNNSSAFLRWTPAVDDSRMDIGSTAATSDLNLYGGTTGTDFRWDASENTVELDDNTILAVGDGDDFTISHNGSITTIAGAYSTTGIVTHTVDVIFDGGATDALWDDSEATFHLNDSTVLGFGNTGATPDVEISWDTDSFNILAQAVDMPLEIGAVGTGFDITYFFETAGQFRTDYDGDFINLTDDMEIRFGTGASSDGDIKISSNSASVLQIEQVVLDTGTIVIGVTDRDIPLKWWGETAGDFAQFTGDALQLEDIDIALGDGTKILYGDTIGTGDFSVESTSAVLTYLQVVSDTGEINYGVSDTDIPIKWFAETAADWVYFNADEVEFEDVVLQMMDDTLMHWGDGDDVTMNYDEDGDNDLQITGPITFEGTVTFEGETVLPSNKLLRASVAIADTEMDNLAATPKELVAAVAGSTIEFVSAVFALDWGATAWTEPSAPDDLVVRFTNGSGAIVSHLLDATGFATATEDTVAFVGSNVSDAAGADVASVAVTEANSTNKALVLHNTGAEWTNSGDSQVVVITYYRLHTTAELGL